MLLAVDLSIVKDNTQVKKTCPSPQAIQKRLLKQTPSAILKKKHAYLVSSVPLAVIKRVSVGFVLLIYHPCIDLAHEHCVILQPLAHATPRNPSWHISWQRQFAKSSSAANQSFSLRTAAWNDILCLSITAAP